VKARWKTAEKPSRSAVVTYPVAFTNRANASFVTVVASIRNGGSVTSCTGLSPSSG